MKKSNVINMAQFREPQPSTAVILGVDIAGIIDPNQAYPDKTPMQILVECGGIPSWIARRTGYNGFEECLINEYGLFYTGPMEGGKVNLDTGVYTYPKDPDLEPLMACYYDGETVIQYPYGIVAVLKDSNPDDQWIARLD